MNRIVGGMTLTTPSEREIAMSRAFDAPRELVFAAYTRPELLKRWLGVHNGWILAVCEIDLRVGGAYRWVWRGPGREEMGMGGTYLEIVVPERVVATEKFDDAWYPGEAVTTIDFVENGGRTTLTIGVLYESKAARDAVLASPMEHGVSAGFETLAGLLAEQRASGH